ncbi:hypothetical protein MalM25_35250 [Planctomycetes bacterium MalM25]|nr:hypothetical protein MalM25_35250 [Planctomycetes bacterium MalM25]
MLRSLYSSPTVRRYGLQTIGLALFGLAIVRQWPIDSLQDDGTTLFEALFGLACVLGPDEVVQYGSLRGQGYSSYTASEARTFEDADAVRVIGLVLLIDAHAGVGKRLIGACL